MIPVYFSKPAVLCAAGSSTSELWTSLINGSQKGLKKTTALDGKEFWAGKIDDSQLSEKSSARYDMRIMRIEEKCLLQVEEEIKLAVKTFGAEKTGVCVGSCDNGTEFSVAGHRFFFKNGSFASDYSLEIQGADYPATFISEKYGLKGPSLVFSTACSSSAGAIIKASELIRAGICDAVVCGGIDIASNTVLMGFNSLEAVSPEKTNPFSRNRHGITLAEGAAFFVMSRTPLTSEKTGSSDSDSEASVPAVKLLGYGESADAYHMTSPDPSGEGAFSSMEKALKMSGLSPDQIDYLNLHGTGTKFNDSMEAKAVNRIFNDYRIPCSSTKSLTGHTLGAAGALEAAICWLTLAKNCNSQKIRLPVQVWDKIHDEELPELNIISPDSEVLQKAPVTCMSNSFAFGGANASLILGF